MEQIVYGYIIILGLLIITFIAISLGIIMWKVITDNF
jgi:hypothetical protein